MTTLENLNTAEETRLRAHKSRPEADPKAILNISFYRFFTWNDPLPIAKQFIKDLIIRLDLYGTVLIAPEGINGFLAGKPEHIREAISKIEDRFKLRALQPKESFSSHIPFRRQLVKIKREIITTGRPDLRPDVFSGKRVMPVELKSWLDKNPEEVILLDTRNDYEVELGTFKNAEHYNIRTFKQFEPKFKEKADSYRGKKIVMFCTGGIRCEKASAFGKEVGMEDNVYQLEGGILKYLEETDGSHYQGSCFVFDGRVAVDPTLSAQTDKKYQKSFGQMDLLLGDEREWTSKVLFWMLNKKGVSAQILKPNRENYQNIRNSVASRLTPNNFIYVHGHFPLEGILVTAEYLDECSGREVNPILPVGKEDRARTRIWIQRVESQQYRTSPEHFFPLAERRLEKRSYLIANELTLADVVFAAILLCTSEGEKAIQLNPKLGEWVQKVNSEIALIGS